MSHFNKITIRGIRSFSASERGRQTVEFGSPLTVILGENGTGKTSIIECLRFVCSGEYPPGGREAFLHSLNLPNARTAEGEIELGFTNKASRDVAIRRCVTIAKNKRQQEGWYRLGGVRQLICFNCKVLKPNTKNEFHIRRHLRHILQAPTIGFLSCSCDLDQWQPVTSKKDLSVMINDDLGVSSAILSNVLFCHQDESCWPLDKERALKEKFDRFFEVTGYNKLLAELTTMINKQKCEMVRYEDQAVTIERKKETFARLSRVIEKEELEKAQLQQEVDDLEIQTLAMEEELSHVKQRIHIGEDIKKEISYLEGRRRDLDTDRLRIKERLRRKSSEVLCTKDLQEELLATEGGIKKLERLKKISVSKAEVLRKEMEGLKALQILEQERALKQQRIEELGLALADRKDDLKAILTDLVSQCRHLPNDLEQVMEVLIGMLDNSLEGDLKKQALQAQDDVWKSVEALSIIKGNASKITNYVQGKIMDLQMKLQGMDAVLETGLPPPCKKMRLEQGFGQQAEVLMQKDALTSLACRMCLLDETLTDLDRLEVEICKYREACIDYKGGKGTFEEAAKEHDDLIDKIEDIDDNLKQCFEKLSECRREEEKKNLQNEERGELDRKRTLALETDAILEGEKKKLEAATYRQLKTEEEQLRTYLRNINSRKFTCKGKLTELTRTIAERRSNCSRLEGEVLREARDNTVNLMTMRDVNHDLVQYRDALDEAILKYHRMKMLEVNEEIHRLWTKTYQGNDIDCIKIEAAVSKGDGRRAYNYRVEMVKGNQRMNMRERCSMGQKVLASLIIRIALARIFGGSCGVLALDEPTTNLDEPTVRALAKALKSIIREAASQTNFQLIIISHNKMFVDLLAQDYGKHCYRVSRDLDKHTVVRKYRSAFCHAQHALMATGHR